MLRIGFVKRTGETDSAAAISEETKPEPPLPLSIPADDAFSRYVAVDEALQTVEAASDAEICFDVQMAGSLSADTNDSDDEPESEAARCPPAAAPPVSLATANDSPENIRSYPKAAGCQSLKQFYSRMVLIYNVHMQQTVVQTIKDFFKRI